MNSVYFQIICKEIIIMLRGCVSLVSRVSPVTQVMRGMSRRAPGTNRVKKPLMLELNKRREVVERDNRLKNKDNVARRSSYSDWNYPAELKALQVNTMSSNILWDTLLPFRQD